MGLAYALPLLRIQAYTPKDIRSAAILEAGYGVLPHYLGRGLPMNKKKFSEPGPNNLKMQIIKEEINHAYPNRKRDV